MSQTSVFIQISCFTIVERYTTHDPPVPPQYYTAEVNGHVKGLKAQKTKKPHPADAQPDQIDTEVNTEELPDTESSELDTFCKLQPRNRVYVLSKDKLS